MLMQHEFIPIPLGHQSRSTISKHHDRSRCDHATCRGGKSHEKLTNKDESLDYDPKRTLRWATIGLTLHGPYFFYSFDQLDRIFGASTSISVAARKTIFGQLVIFPPYLTVLFSYMGLLEGMDRADIVTKVKDCVPKAFMSGCVFWPVVNLFNFRYVPVKMRIVYLAGVGALWNGYLSYLNQKDVVAQ
jgi:protein Mpv17